tara:strand:+ start:6300 stop:7628 length:1329 start_codon:yes stop_codon:yes gene_type:complete
MDYNTDNYSITELYELISLDAEQEITTETIDNATDKLIKYYNETNDEELKNFFIKIKKILIDDIYVSNNEETILIKEEKIGNDITLQDIKSNPNFNNIIERMVNIDSTFRLNSFPHKSDQFRYSELGNVETTIYSNTNFTCNLTEKLNNVLSITLHSVQIPYSWYNITRFNNSIKVNDTTITVPPGNYSITELTVKINELFASNSLSITMYYNIDNSYKINIKQDTSNNIIFYEQSESFIDSKSNHNLGWSLGFRNSIYNELDFTAEALVDINGPKYFNLSVDEFKSNISNRGVVSIETSENKLSLPSYFSNDLLLADTPEENDRLIPQYSNIREINNVLLSKNITKAQETTINEIIKSRNETTNTKLIIPKNDNVFALIHYSVGDYGKFITLESRLEINKRVYLGPINIDKLKIVLTDDIGNIVDLNGLDWSFSFIAEHLY